MTTAADIHTLGEVRDIHDIVPSPLNPRRSFNPERLKELAASIESKGVIEPLIVRSRPGLGQLEIVAGERRYRAAKSVGVKELPVIIRTLTDVEVLELIAIENLQRDDLHPLEEADGYAALMKADRAYTPKAIAAKIGKSERYVQQRLQLATLEPEVKTHFLENHITAGHADLISRLAPADQKRAIKRCFENLYGEDKERGSISVRELNRWIDENIRLTLTPGNRQIELLPDVAKVIETPDAVTKILQVSTSYTNQVAGVVPRREFKELQGKKDRCAHAERAVIVIGDGRGRLIDVCRAKTDCVTHWKYHIEELQRRQRAKAQTTKKAPKSAKDKHARAAQKRADAAVKKRRDLSMLRSNVLERGCEVAQKTAPNKPVPAVLRLIGWNRGTEDRYKTWRALILDELAEGSWRHDNEKEWAKAVAMFKAFGVDLKAIEKELAAEAQTSAKPKKGKAA
jgi:ParB/RepB/Spo0J family partition protein